VQGNGNGIPATRAACVDAETLAAWVDGGLPKAEAAAVEMHLAECERCTAMVATFARTIPDAPVAESLWTRWHLRWLVPLATAATVAAVWVLVPRPESPQMTTLGRGPTTESQAAAAANAAQPATTTETKEQEARTAPAPSKPADAFAKREESPQVARPEVARPVVAGQWTDQQRADADQAAKRLQAEGVNESIAVAPPLAQEADRAEAKSADAKTERFSPPIPSANAAPAPAAPAPATSPAAEASARRAPPAAPSPAAAAQPAAAPHPAALGAASSTQARVAASQPVRERAAIVEIPSPDPMIRWRVVGAGQVERSTNGGARWEAAKLPESATLIAGSSPSPSICWLVGRTGSIYVTTDGLRFVRVPFRDRTDFVSIQATDGRRATVVTIDGRTMRTDDQGATWVRISP
jgi:anti-sigma factor RsiW